MTDVEWRRVGHCTECHEDDVEVVPYDGGMICQVCADDVHRRGRTTLWWAGPAIAHAPAPSTRS